MSWLIQDKSEPSGEEPRKKATKTQDSEQAIVKKLVVQLEARVRTLEYGGASQVFLAVDHPLVESCKAKYDQYLKTVREEGPKHTRGPPELQLYSKALQDIENWLSQDVSVQLRRFRGLPSRVLMMMEKGTGEDASEWVKDWTLSPTFEAKKMRLTIGLKGAIAVADNEPLAIKLNEAQKEAWNGVDAEPEKYEHQLQRSPLEMPALTGGLKHMELMHVMTILLRAWGGVKKVGRVPRGEMPKQLLGKKA